MADFANKRAETHANNHPLAAPMIRARMAQMAEEIEVRCTGIFDECSAVHAAVAEAERVRAERGKSKPAKLALVA